MDQPPPRVIAIYQQFARHRAVGKGLDPRVAIEPRIEHESRHQPLMRAAEIAHRDPDISGRSIDRNVLVNGSHGYLPLEGAVILRCERRDAFASRAERASKDEWLTLLATILRDAASPAPQDDGGVVGLRYAHTASTLLPSGSIRNAAK